jgi:phosphopantothenoylcysteine synthetase/decarboxylase
VRTFSTTASLRAGLLALRDEPVDAVFHAAAVSDFAFGTVWQPSATGELTVVKAGKIPTRAGRLLVELLPTPKLILELRDWFPRARLIGWKFEVDGGRAEVLQAARAQLAGARTDLCVVNGPAYGPGFGLVTAAGEQHLADAPLLQAALAAFILPR